MGGAALMTTGNGTDAVLRHRPTRDLVSDLTQQGSTLVRQEIELAKVELIEKGQRAGLAAGMFAGSALAAVLMLGSLTAVLIIVLALFLPLWLSALLVTLLWGTVSGALAYLGRERAREIGKPIPEQTFETVKEDVQWLKHRK
jgi:uncharacterized membrane protein YqjE